MSLKKEESVEFGPTAFIRGSKSRKVFRIRQRFNSKLPPAAVLYMKSLEHYQVNKFESVKSDSTFYVTITENFKEEDEEELQISNFETFENLYDDEQKLIANSPVFTRRSSSQKVRVSRKKIKLNKIINFFKK